MQFSLKRPQTLTVSAYLLLIVIGLALVVLSDYVPGVSALMVAIVIGIIVRNTPIHKILATFPIGTSSKTLLRIGIVLLGFKLSFSHLLDIGLAGVTIIVVTIACTYVGTLFVGKWMSIPRGLRTLIATGFSICGASAVVAMTSVTDPKSSKDEETAHAVALVTIYGSLVMLLFPVLAKMMNLSDDGAGIWFGASIHEVAQVVAAGGLFSAAALTVATVVKLARVVFLAPLIALVGWYENRRNDAADETLAEGKKPPIIPLFVIFFLIAVCMRTLLPLPTEMLTLLDFGANTLLAAAMFGLGFGIEFKKLLTTGWQPAVLGFFSTLIAASISLAGVFLLNL